MAQFNVKKATTLQNFQPATGGKPQGQNGGTTQARNSGFRPVPVGQGSIATYIVTPANAVAMLETIRQTIKDNDLNGAGISKVLILLEPGTYSLPWQQAGQLGLVIGYTSPQQLTIEFAAANGDPSSVTINFVGASGGAAQLINLFNIHHSSLVWNIGVIFNFPVPAGRRGVGARIANGAQGQVQVNVLPGGELNFAVGAGGIGAIIGINDPAAGVVETPGEINNVNVVGCDPGEINVSGAGDFGAALKVGSLSQAAATALLARLVSVNGIFNDTATTGLAAIRAFCIGALDLTTPRGYTVAGDRIGHLAIFDFAAAPVTYSILTQLMARFDFSADVASTATVGLVPAGAAPIQVGELVEAGPAIISFADASNTKNVAVGTGATVNFLANGKVGEAANGGTINASGATTLLVIDDLNNDAAGASAALAGATLTIGNTETIATNSIPGVLGEFNS